MSGRATPILAIDQGTTSTRAILFAPDGSARELATFAHRQHRPGPGRVEHDPEELLSHVALCLEAGRRAGATVWGLANQGESCLAWEAGTGRPIGPVIVWQDDRTAAVTARLAAAGAEAETLARAGLPLDPYFSASKLAWLLDHLPEARRLAAAGRLRLGTTDAFFRERLTGVCATDPTTASRTSLMNLATLAWDATLCALFGVPEESLPPIRPTTGDLGAGLAASVVDQQAALHGHGCASPGDLKITFGTGAFALCLTDRPAPAGRGPLPTVAWARAGEAAVFALDGGVYAAGAAVNWAQELGLFRDPTELDRFAGPPAIERGLVFVPALSGLACPHWDRAARGAWFGLDLADGPRDLARAVLEGIALRTAEVVEAMAGLVPIAEPVRIDGGLSANASFVAFLADALGRSLRVSADPELTARGTAQLAAQGAGLAAPPLADGRLVSPSADGAAWRARFAAARALVQRWGSVAPRA